MKRTNNLNARTTQRVGGRLSIKLAKARRRYREGVESYNALSWEKKT